MSTNRRFANWLSGLVSVLLLTSMFAAPVLASVAANTVNSVAIMDFSIRSVDIASKAIATGKIAEGAVTTKKLKDGTIRNRDIASDAGISASKISRTGLDADKLGAIPTAVAARNRISITSAPAVSITKVDSLDPIPVGGQTVYTVTVDNTGDTDLTDVIVSDTMPAGMSYVASNPTAEVTGSELLWSVGHLTAGESIVINITAKGVAAGWWINSASVTSNEGVSVSTSEETLVAVPNEPAITITPTTSGSSVIFTATRADVPVSGVGVFLNIAWHPQFAVTDVNGKATFYNVPWSGTTWTAYYQGIQVGAGRLPVVPPNDSGKTGAGILPVVLIRGWGDGDADSYWTDVKTRLIADGYEDNKDFYIAHIDPAAGMVVNAKNLEAIDVALDGHHAKKVNVLTHSMGGLIARAYVAIGMTNSDKVAGILTLGTPHTGTDLATKLIDSHIPTNYLGLPVGSEEWDSTKQLRPAQMRSFNERVANYADVPMVVVAGRPLFQTPSLLISKPNDGIVPLYSAKGFDFDRGFLGPSRVDADLGSDVKTIVNDDYHNTAVGPLVGLEEEDLKLRTFLDDYATYKDIIKPFVQGKSTKGGTDLPHMAGAHTSRAGRVKMLSEPDLPEIEQQVLTKNGRIAPGQTVEYETFVDPTVQAAFSLIWPSDKLGFSLIDPNDTVIDTSTPESNPNVEVQAINDTKVVSYTITEPTPGRWKLVVSGAEASGATDYLATAGVLSNLTLGVATDKEGYQPGQNPVVLASAATATETAPDAFMDVTIKAPDDSTSSVILNDQGILGDTNATDGIFSGAYPGAAQGGFYDIYTEATGTFHGQSFARIQQGLFSVSKETAALTGAIGEEATDTDGNGFYENFNISAGVDAHGAGGFQLFGELANSSGTVIDSLITPFSTTEATQTTVTLPFRGDVIYKSGQNGPYTLKTLELLDASGTPTSLETTTNAYTTAAYQYGDFQYENMEIDPLPELATTNPSNAFTGRAVFSTGTIKTIDYSLDGGASWLSASSDDGSFNEANETFSVATGALPDGNYALWARALLNETTATSEANYTSTNFIVDTAKPTGYLSLDSDAVYTLDPTVTVDLDSTDTAIGSGVKEMRLALSPSALSAAGYKPYSTTDTISIGAADGQKTVYAQFKDEVGHESDVVSASIALDRVTPPIDPIVTSSNPLKDAWSNLNTVLVNFFGASDWGSGVDGYSVSWTKDAIGLPDTLKGMEKTELFATSPLLTDGSWYFNLRTKDNAGNWSSTLHYGPFKIDRIKPTGTALINGGASYAKSTAVTLNLTSSDGSGSGLDKMRFQNDGGTWSAWQAYAATAVWGLTAGDGTKKVSAQFKDKAGNESVAVDDTIVLDTVKPISKVSSPNYASDTSKNDDFTVTWSGTDPSPASGVASYDVQYKIGTSGAWKNYKTSTTLKSALFNGSLGKTYYFRSRAKDKAGNIGNWSAEDKTIVPLDQKVMSASGVWASASNSNLYKGTSKASVKKGAKLTYSFSGAKSIALIVTKRSNGGYADVYIGAKKIRIISLYAKTTKFRAPVAIKSSSAAFSGTLKVIVKGTKPSGSSGMRVEIDGVGIGK